MMAVVINISAAIPMNGQKDVLPEGPITLPVIVVIIVSLIVSFLIIVSTSSNVVSFVSSVSSGSIPREIVRYFFMSSSSSE